MRIKEDSRQNLKYSNSLIILIMKWKHYGISLLMAHIIFVNVASSQTYSFIYKFTDSIMLSFQEKKPGNESEADTVLMDLLNKLPIKLKGTYTIVSNGKYMIVKAAVSSSFSGIRPTGIHFSEPEEIIFDIENRLVYFAE
jgi:hypothetical protein